ncbi:Sucrose transport protein SUC5 [Linum perenne]
MSLLTLYVQLLGIPHDWAAFIWLCGPISGIVVQPIVGYFSDRSTCQFGRRSPFIIADTVLAVVAVFLIGYAADIGYHYGDSLNKGRPRVRAIVVFTVGFWVLDVANNMLQGPCRALLGDLSGDNQRLTRFSNSLFSSFMGAGNILGHLAGSRAGLHKLFKFSRTTACDVHCANLKSCFIISAALLIVQTGVAIAYVREQRWCSKVDEGRLELCDVGKTEKNDVGRVREGGLTSFLRALKILDRATWMLLLVTCLNWFAWFPWVLYSTDWVGREVYGGRYDGTPSQVLLYDRGVQVGSVGLMINSIVLLIVALAIDLLARKLGVWFLWGFVNLVLGICLAMTVVISMAAKSERDEGGTVSSGIKSATLAVFGVLGLPLAVTYNIPFAMGSIYSQESGTGQGMSVGVLNLAICLPQVVISLGSGPLVAAFGGGNLPAFMVGAVAAIVSAVCAATLLEKMSSKGPTTPKSPSTRNRSKAKLKKENGVASLSGPSESAKNPLKNGANLQFEPSRVQCGPIRQKKKGGSKSKGNSPSGKKHKVVESWQWNHRPFSPRQNQQQQQQQQKRKKPWQGAEQGMAYYLKFGRNAGFEARAELLDLREGSFVCTNSTRDRVRNLQFPRSCSSGLRPCLPYDMLQLL